MALIGSLGGGEELAYLSADALAGFGICMGMKFASGYSLTCISEYQTSERRTVNFEMHLLCDMKSRHERLVVKG